MINPENTADFTETVIVTGADHAKLFRLCFIIVLLKPQKQVVIGKGCQDLVAVEMFPELFHGMDCCPLKCQCYILRIFDICF